MFRYTLYKVSEYQIKTISFWINSSHNPSEPLWCGRITLAVFRKWLADRFPFPRIWQSCRPKSPRPGCRWMWTLLKVRIWPRSWRRSGPTTRRSPSRTHRTSSSGTKIRYADSSSKALHQLQFCLLTNGYTTVLLNTRF